MRKLFFIIVLFFSTSVLADLAEVYFCETSEYSAIIPDKNVDVMKLIADPEDKYSLVEFNGGNFSFKISEDKIIFNKNKKNFFKGSELTILEIYPDIFHIKARDNYGVLSFDNGHFFYTANFGVGGTRNIYAQCESFE